MAVGQKIRDRREELGLTQDELAEMMNYKDRSTIAKIEKGINDITQSKVAAFAKVLMTTPSYLMGWDEKKTDDPLYSIAVETVRYKEVKAMDDRLNADGHEEWIKYGGFLAGRAEYKQDKATPIQRPMIRHYFTAAAAGYIAPIEGEQYEEIPLPEDAPFGADFCIDISGDSMEPYIHDGSMVYVKRDVSLTQFEPGIFYYAGDVYCKQICEDYVGGINLLSANPKREDANIHITRDQLQYLVCFGKVILPHKLPMPEYI